MGVESAWRFWLDVRMFIKYFLLICALEGRSPGQEFVDHDCQRILVGCGYSVTSPLLRSHIDWCPADGLAFAGNRIHKFRDTKVGQLYVQMIWLVFTTDNKKVRGFNITVNDSTIMCMLQSTGGLA